MSDSNLDKTYDHRDVEPRWLERWRDGGWAQADAESDKPPFTVMIPPPNVTGSLHMGHALTLTIQDSIVRWKRMSGFNTLWLPGTDHAGIATQMVVERKLAEEGISRFDLGREKFIEKIWEWKEIYHARITEQMNALGTSCDWSRERFTMDDGLSRAVREVFVSLYEDGLIYRDDRMVNWSPGAQTVISDLEVVFEDRDGSMWHMAYPVDGTDRTLVVATTRPETMLGDTAVAVHPDDPRYQDLIGKQIKLPLTGRLIPIVADDILVDMAFGTGAVKVTPAHDPNDFEVGRRHNLEFITILDHNAKVNTNAPEAYQGLDRFEARKRIVADLDALGLLVKIEPHKLSVGTCDRTGSVVEPRLSKQWYVKVAPLAEKATDAVRSGRTKIVPQTWEKTYFHWMDNIRDWCISRQLWWGHQIPAWHCADCGAVTVHREDPSACQSCSSTNIERDTDVLDTWFSSGLWPFSTLGWPDETPDLKTFYPGTLMETGFDILFFWVARMMMMGLHFMGEVPFDTVLLHAMVRDEKGKKMSKSKGNVIDPLVVSKEYGADSLRMALASMAGQGRDIKLAMGQVELNRNFVNKIWNASRFALMNLEDFDPAAPKPTTLGLTDRWILGRLAKAVETANTSLDKLAINEAANALFHFFWSEFCDWYIELAKPVLYADDGNMAARHATQWTLVTVLDNALRALHPFIPFATEEIWSKLPLGADRPEALMIARYPQAADWARDGEAEAAIELLKSVITAVRNVRGELNLGSGKPVPVVLRAPTDALATLLEQEQHLISRLARTTTLSVQSGGDRPKGAAMQIADGIDVFVPLAGLIDFPEELVRLEKSIAKNEKSLLGIRKKLGNASFVSRAPDAVVQKEKDRETALISTLEKLADSKQRIEALAADQA
jgi:valyl-tRNA synthetase